MPHWSNKRLFLKKSTRLRWLHFWSKDVNIVILQTGFFVMLSQDSSYDFWAILALPKLLMFKRKLLYKIIWSKTINYWGGKQTWHWYLQLNKKCGGGGLPDLIGKEIKNNKTNRKGLRNTHCTFIILIWMEKKKIIFLKSKCHLIFKKWLLQQYKRCRYSFFIFMV